MKTATLHDFLTDEQICRCIELKSRKRVLDEVLRPNIKTINEKLGQENDPAYLSFAVEYAMTKAGFWKTPATKWN